MLVRIANREDPDQKQSDHCFTVCLGLFLQAISVQNLERLLYICNNNLCMLGNCAGININKIRNIISMKDFFQKVDYEKNQ